MQVFDLLYNNIVNYLPILILYAELHYTFSFLKSRYFINEPEIISDVPIRIEPNKKLPLLIIIKDSNKYPVYLKNIYIKLYKTDKFIQKYSYKYNKLIKTRWWEDIINI